LDLVLDGLTVAAALHLVALAVETLDFVPDWNEDIVIDLRRSMRSWTVTTFRHWTRFGVAV
jgi:hypothetical protein